MVMAYKTTAMSLQILTQAMAITITFLQQIDNDGKIAYSPVQVVNFSQLTTALSVYPNPVVSAINFNKNFAAGTTLQIINSIGQVVEKSVFSGNKYQPKTQLKGMCKIVITGANNNRSITNIVVQQSKIAL